MKGFGGFVVLMLVIVILICAYSVHEYIATMSPVWEVSAAQQAAIDIDVARQNAAVDVQTYQERAQLFTNIMVGIGVLVILLASGFGGVHVWRVHDIRKESWARAVDGTFALQEFSNGGVKWQVDPNRQLTGTIGFHKATGQLGEFSGAAGADRQLAYNMSVQKTRTTTAMMTNATGPKYTAHAKLLAGAYDKPSEMPKLITTDSEEEEELLTWKALTAEDAFAQSDSNRWILGQSPTTGELFELNPKEAAHFGVVGATGAGKTVYTALMLMAYAMRNKFRVSVLDGKGGADWSKYKDFVEYSPLDYTNVGGIIGQMMSEYEKRQAILNQYGVNSIWELPSGVTKPRPTLFIVDEFGAVMDSLKAASRNAYKAVELDLGNLLRLSRGAGLYVVLCDQNPSKWPGTIRANMPMNICYRLGGNIGNAVNEYSLDRLSRVGQFQVSNTIYNAFPTYQVIDDLLSSVDYKKPKALLTIDSTINSGGVSTRQNDSTPTRVYDSTIEEITPVSDSTINSAGNSGNSNDSTINSAPLTSKPLSRKEIELVKNTFALTNKSRKRTVEILYGKWTVSRDGWVKDIVNGEILQ